jgi:hypothetical protein
MDAIVDQYFPVIDNLVQTWGTWRNIFGEKFTRETTAQIYHLKTPATGS